MSAPSSLSLFTPAVQSWFLELGQPTPSQEAAWPLLQAGHDVVVAAPTGSGKTLAAFLVALDGLARQAEAGALADEVQVIYVSPLKALSNDVGKNLLRPLEGVAARLGAAGAIRVAVRTGDTSAKERAAMPKKPPHVLVTTPESLFVMLGSSGGQRLLRTARTIILDEVHAVCGTRRGAHQALSVERLDALVTAHRGQPLQRVGLSATQRPIDLVARFISGAHRPPARVVDVGHRRTLDLQMVLPDSPLEAIMSGEIFAEVIRSLANQVEAHTTTLIFVNTRRMAERLASRLDDALADPERSGLGRGLVCAHHGSMSKDKRKDAEDRLKSGQLRALVATASMELGIDVGAIDLVCQLGSTKTIAALLQRVGRAGHQTGLVPKGRLYPLTRDELVEAAAVMHAVDVGDLDALVIPDGGVDVLAQHAVAMVAAAVDVSADAADDADVDSAGVPRAEVYELARRAWPFRHFDKNRIDTALDIVTQGVVTGRGRRGAWLYADDSAQTLRPKRGARLAALTSGGVIPDMGDYAVVDHGNDQVVGTVNEDFAVESLPGSIFQLGATSWRIEKIEPGVVRVSDARGQPPNIPFWFGEAPARSRELSAHVAVVREVVSEVIDAHDGDSLATVEAAVAAALRERFFLPAAGAAQLAGYLVACHVALGALPTQKQIIVERFEDSLGGTQLVIHAPFGARITRAWGLSLRKRFCRSFDFELQAAATEDGIILSVGTVSGVDLDALVRFVTPKNIEEVLIQAVLQSPMFGTRFRHNVTRSLTVLRNRGGKRIPPGLIRLDAEDVLVALFPMQVACAENIPGDREVPDEPLVQQTMHDCLHEWMDVDGARELLADIEAGRVRVKTVERAEPSPLAMELVGARPYAFLDDVPFEERRVQAILARRSAEASLEDESQALDPAVVSAIVDEARLDVRNVDEAWDALQVSGFVWGRELGAFGPTMAAHVASLVKSGRAVSAVRDGDEVFVAREARELLESPTHEGLMQALRGRLESFPPMTRAALTALSPTPADLVGPVLSRLVKEGVALEGHFDTRTHGEVTDSRLAPVGDLSQCSSAGADEMVLWSRRLVIRARRRMLDRLRAAIAPVSPEALMRALVARHHLKGSAADPRFLGREGLQAALRLLDGVTAPAAAWEEELFPARVSAYLSHDLDALCLGGAITWRCRAGRAEGGGSIARQTALTIADRDTAAWLFPRPEADGPQAALSSTAALVTSALSQHGPLFYRELGRRTGLISDQLEGAVAEAVGHGLVTSDGYGAVRGLVLSAKDKGRRRRSHKARIDGSSLFELAGRFSLLASDVIDGGGAEDDVGGGGGDVYAQDVRAERHARALLARYGVVFRKLCERDPLLPPWRQLLAALRRLEVRGDVRGGRFVAGFAGEQFALPEVVAALRATRDEATGNLVVISAADPLNLTGHILPCPRVAAIVGHRIALKDGHFVGSCDGDEVVLADDVAVDDVDAVRRALRAPRLRLAHA